MRPKRWRTGVSGQPLPSAATRSSIFRCLFPDFDLELCLSRDKAPVPVRGRESQAEAARRRSVAGRGDAPRRSARRAPRPARRRQFVDQLREVWKAPAHPISHEPKSGKSLQPGGPKFESTSAKPRTVPQTGGDWGLRSKVPPPIATAQTPLRKAMQAPTATMLAVPGSEARAFTVDLSRLCDRPYLEEVGPHPSL